MTEGIMGCDCSACSLMCLLGWYRHGLRRLRKDGLDLDLSNFQPLCSPGSSLETVLVDRFHYDKSKQVSIKIQ